MCSMNSIGRCHHWGSRSRCWFIVVNIIVRQILRIIFWVYLTFLWWAPQTPRNHINQILWDFQEHGTSSNYKRLNNLPAFIDPIIYTSRTNAFTTTIVEPSVTWCSSRLARLFAFVPRHALTHVCNSAVESCYIFPWNNFLFRKFCKSHLMCRLPYLKICRITT